METFEYTECYVPPQGQGFIRYTSATLQRSEDRKYWETEGPYGHRFVMNDFGFLVHVGLNIPQ